MHKISTRHMFQEKFGGISPLLLFVMVRSYLLHLHKNGPSQDIFSQEYQLFFTSYLQGSFLHNTLPSYILHLFDRKPYCIQDVVQDLFIRRQRVQWYTSCFNTREGICTLQFDQWSYIEVKHSSIYRKHFILVIETLDATRQILFEQRILSDSISNHPKHCYKRFLYRKMILNNHTLALHLTSYIRHSGRILFQNS